MSPSLEGVCGLRTRMAGGSIWHSAVGAKAPQGRSAERMHRGNNDPNATVRGVESQGRSHVLNTTFPITRNRSSGSPIGWDWSGTSFSLSAALKSTPRREFQSRIPLWVVHLGVDGTSPRQKLRWHWQSRGTCLEQKACDTQRAPMRLSGNAESVACRTARVDPSTT